MYKNRKNKIDLDKGIIEYFSKGIPLALFIEDFELSYSQVEYIYNKVKPILELEHEDNENKSTISEFKTTEKIYKSYSIKELLLFIRKIKRIAKTYNAKIDNNIEKKLNDIQNELISKNIGLIYECLNIFFHDIEMPKDDAVMYGIYGLYDALSKHSYYSKISFKQHAINRIINNIKNHFYELTGMSWENFKNKRYIDKNSISEDYIEEGSNDKYDLPMTFEDYEEIDNQEDQDLHTFDTYDIDDEIEIKEAVKEELNKISRRTISIIEMYYGLNGHKSTTLSQLTTEFRTSISRIAFIKKRTEKRIRENILLPVELTKEDNNKISEIDYKYQYVCKLIQAGINLNHFAKFLAMNNFSCTEEEILKIILDINEIFKLVGKYRYDIFSIREELMAREDILSLEIIKYIMINYDCLKLHIADYLSNNNSENKKLQKNPL